MYRLVVARGTVSLLLFKHRFRVANFSSNYLNMEVCLFFWKWVFDRNTCSSGKHLGRDIMGRVMFGHVWILSLFLCVLLVEGLSSTLNASLVSTCHIFGLHEKIHWTYKNWRYQNCSRSLCFCRSWIFCLFLTFIIHNLHWIELEDLMYIWWCRLVK